MANTTSSYFPSSRDLLMAVPRLAQRLGSFAFHLPDQFDNLLGKVQDGGSVIAEPTTTSSVNATVITSAAGFAQDSAAASFAAGAAGTAAPAVQGWFGWMNFENLRNLGGIFMYLTSRWAMATFAAAIILDRTRFYASSRTPLNFRWPVRLAAYIVPIVMFCFQIVQILEAMRCQTSPAWPLMRYGDPDKQLSIDHAGEGGFLYSLSSTLLFWQDDAASCSAVNMMGSEGNSVLQGSLARLWPLFGAICLSHFVDTLSCALQGLKPLPETGMTVFEHSLAFAEAETMITRPFDLGLLKAKTTSGSDGESMKITRSMVLGVMNVPAEVLLISLISCFSHLSSNVLAAIGLRTRFRFVNTAIWGIAYMVALVWSLSRFMTSDKINDIGILRFPTVCIVGFIPHLLIFLGMLACAAVYGIAILLTAAALPPGSHPRSLRERLTAAYDNLQANMLLSTSPHIEFSWQNDFYSTLLKTGFVILTAASEAVYLQESAAVRVSQTTWLEEKRVEEIAQRRRRLKRSLDVVPVELRELTIAEAATSSHERNAPGGSAVSGYARERKTRGNNKASEASLDARTNVGVGLQQRRGRWSITFEFLKGVCWLVAGLYSRLIIWSLEQFGIAYRPRWLMKLAGREHDSKKEPLPTRSDQPPGTLDFWLLSEDGQLSLPSNLNVDVETETRNRLNFSGTLMGAGNQSEILDNQLYGWWKTGGWWGELDTSGSYHPPPQDDDTTSVVSMSTNAETDDGWSDVASDSGRRTPTQQNPYPSSRESTPAVESVLDHARLAALLDPQTTEDQQEARMLARHLQSQGIMTRSGYQQALARERSQVLTSSRYSRAGLPAPDALLTPEQEERMLEQFIIAKRKGHALSNAPQPDNAAAWESGADGMGSGGPQCVRLFAHSRLIQAHWLSHQLSYASPSNFMQSEPHDNPQTASTQETHIDSPSPPSQHGLQHDYTSPPALPSDGGQGEAESSSGNTNAVPDASQQRRVEDSGETARLNTVTTPTGKRIEEYEQSVSSSPRRKPDGPLFEVIKNTKKPGDKKSPIASLPNEILTHALSHLAPADLSAVSMVSHRFHNLVTTPHAWRSAFARYFPGPDSLSTPAGYVPEDGSDDLRSGRRSFTRLTALASWRSEYILRTRLLRSLARGKPMQVLATPASARLGINHVANTITMYNSQLVTTVNHLHATFGTGLNKRLPRFIHGADDVGMASSSDPNSGKTDSWGSSDPQSFLQFFERFPGEAQYGLGAGDVVGVPNTMDVSQPYGMVYGEGFPGGSVYFRHVEEMRGRFVTEPIELTMLPDLGIPQIPTALESICSVWIAKSSSVPSLTEGLVGIMSGSATGVVTAYSLGFDQGFRDHRLGRGEVTARWVLSPGVPIIALAVDDSYSLKRHAQNRIWAVALNALGEVFYLTKFPNRANKTRTKRAQAVDCELLAWATGRTVYWNLVESSRRTARVDPYSLSDTDGSYSPRSSWDGMCLAKSQIQAETREIESFLHKRPKDFQKACHGWDMRRRLEVDFSNDDGNFAGEAVIVFRCGLEEDSEASVMRYTRCKFEEKNQDSYLKADAGDATPASEPPSLFGGTTPSTGLQSPASGMVGRLNRRSSALSSGSSPERSNLIEEWRSSELTFGGLKSLQVTTTALDCSTYATLTQSEDPALGFSGMSNASSPFASPTSTNSQPASPADVPGQRARFIAAGTSTGSVLLWNIRAPVSKSTELVNVIDPVRIIYTDSPQISCLALTALHLVHGGNDGLVQAWDPLASTTQPIRTLNSRFSSRARRRLVQAQASPQGVGINLFAAGAVCLDPDPTVLRGMVSLGTHLRYWSYSSSAADQYKSHKRRLRRSERGSNNGGERFAGTRSGNLKDYIANEKYELEKDKERRKKEADRLAGRFGVDMLNEEEAIAYAAMLSEESLAMDLRRRESDATSAVSDRTWNGGTPTPTPLDPSLTGTPQHPRVKDQEELDAEIAEAIRLSLQGEPASSSSPPYGAVSPTPSGSGFDIPIRYAKNSRASPGGRGRSSPVAKSPPQPKTPSPKQWAGGSGRQKELDDLEFALQLSLAEEQSRKEVERVAVEEGEEFPALSSATGGKGKGRA
ncbi:hypothetical protein W97_00062 [Coniosporium apollinis CBS 100218]|uniref:F-box domain-containing protein n=1 Tax=Coniosporium apollinis (strain CBS 100218) TaxID=1168221 RepID=R7YG16_CONA1|nr:uncharacterized protein W97_00062 [Coniosporium apollinis CBS 100218]EON60852.1 hypothetical protein W97_00062 [Coniosporium apollinis CBS 100218]